MKHSMEALLRPPLELYPGLCAILIASLALANPSYFLLSDFMAISFATLLFIFGGFRTFQAYRVVRYRLVLNQVKDYRITTDRLPKSEKCLLLGKGFAWRTKHTQRIRDLKAYTQSADLRLWFHSILDVLHRIIALLSGRMGNRFMHHADGNPTIHGVGAYDGEYDVCLDLKQKGNHILVFGKAGVGKTRLAETLITQDIHRGDVVVVLDSKNDKKLKECICIEADRAGRVCQTFDLSSPDTTALDWQRALSDKQVIYLISTVANTSQCVDATTATIFSDLASLVGNMHRESTQPAVSRGEIPITIHIDEANSLIDSQFLSLLNGIGQMELRIVVYARTMSDLVAKLNSKWELSQIMSHFPSLLMFQVSDVATTKLLTDQMPEVEVSSLVLVSGSSDDSNPQTSVDFKSSTQARKVTRDVPLVSATDIMQLPKGQCFCLMNGGQLYKLRTLLMLPQRKRNVVPRCLVQPAQLKGC